MVRFLHEPRGHCDNDSRAIESVCLGVLDGDVIDDRRKRPHYTRPSDPPWGFFNMHRPSLFRSAGMCGFLGLLALPAVCIAVQGADPPIAPDARLSSQTPALALQAVRQGVFEAEDQRAPTAADVKLLVDGTRHASCAS